MSEVKEWLFLRNRYTGKDVPVPVSDVDWKAMEAKGDGSKLFDVIRRTKAVVVNVPRVAPEVPKEIQSAPTKEAVKGPSGSKTQK